MKTTTYYTRGLVGAAALGLAVACSGPSALEAPASDGLRAVDIPADFTFATTAGVALSVTAEGLTEPAPLFVMSASGDLVYAGAVDPERGFTAQLGLPLKDEVVRLSLHPGRPEQQLHFAEITDRRVTHRFTR